MTHREYLTYSNKDVDDSSIHQLPTTLAATLAQATGAEGPTRYYNTLCKNNPEALKTLLNNKKFGWPTNEYTGFHIR